MGCACVLCSWCLHASHALRVFDLPMAAVICPPLIPFIPLSGHPPPRNRVTISPVVPFIGAMVLTMIFMASFFVQEEVEAGKFLNPSANKWKFTWLFMTFAIKIMATMLFVPIFGIFAEFSTRCEGGYLGVSLPPGGFAFINNISDRSVRVRCGCACGMEGWGGRG